MLTQFDPGYMMQRSLMLLLSDVRVRENEEHAVAIDFLPEFKREQPLEGASLLPLVLLVNLWSSTSGLCRRVLPRLSLPLAWTLGGTRIEHDFSGGPVDWGETFRRWAVGEQGYVVRNRRREVEQRHAEYVTFLLGEVLVHVRVITEAIRKVLGPKARGPLNNIMQEVDERAARIRTILSQDFAPFYRADDHRMRNPERALRELLATPETTGALRNYARQISLPPLAGSFITDAVESLTNWRSQYMACSVWLSDRTGFKLQQEQDIEHLYEMWCFMELSVAARRCGLGDTIQRTFIAKDRVRPEFLLGSGHYVYYDYRAAKFCRPSPKAHQLLERDFFRPALPGAYVEWFILDPNDYRQSVVIDSKYSGWNNREALKVLGYLMSFGVRRGVIIFADKFNPATIGGRQIVEGLSRLDCPGDSSAQLWVTSLVPVKEEEFRNSKVLDCLVDELFGKQPAGIRKASTPRSSRRR
jgi:hypothetical protein